MPNGGALPFGPYTVGQFLTLVGLLVGGFRTMPMWGGDRGILINGVLLISVCALIVILMRKVPWRGRGPLPLLRGALFGYSRTAGTYRGKPMPIRTPSSVLPAVVVAGEDVMRRAHALAQARQVQNADTVEDLASVTTDVGTSATPAETRDRSRSGPRAAFGRATSAQQNAEPRPVTRPTPAAQNTQPSRLTHPVRRGRGARPASADSTIALPRAGRPTAPLSGLQRLRQQAELADAGSARAAGHGARSRMEAQPASG